MIWKHLCSRQIVVEGVVSLWFGVLFTGAVTAFGVSQASAGALDIVDVSAGPVIDGKAGDKCWAKAQWQSHFTVQGHGKKKASVLTRFKITHDKYYLYFLAECFEPKIGKMKKEYGKEWNGEYVHLFVGTSRHPEKYFVLKANPSGKVYKHAYQGDGTGLDIFVEVPLWEVPIRSKATRDKKRWTVEMALPLAGLGVDAKTTGQWRVNVTRRRFMKGKAEDFTYTQLKGDEVGRPEKFTPAKVGNFDPSIFALNIGEPKLQVSKVEGRLRCSADFTAENTGATPADVRGKVLLETNGKAVIRKAARQALPGTAKTPMEIVFPLNRQGDYVMTLELADAKTGGPLRYLFRKVKLEYRPVRILLRSPTYRNNIYASQNLKQVVAEIAVDESYKGWPVVVELAGPGGYHESLGLDLAKTNIAKFNAAALKDGKYTMTAKFTEGKLPGVVAKVDIRKLPGQAGEVWFDSDNITYIDGKKFLPFGWYNAPLEARLARKVMLTGRQFQSIKQAKQILDEAHANNVKVILEPSQEYDRQWKKVILNIKSGVCKGKMTQKQKRQIRKFVDAVKNHPALLGWYLVDEPELYNVTPEWYADLWAYMQQLDPYHPTIITNCSERGIRDYRNSCDVLLPDYYPNYITGQDPLYPFALTSLRVKFAAEGKPAWFVPQAFCSVAGSRPELNPRAPTFHELRSQIYQVFANNGKGIVMWDFSALSQLYYQLRLGPAYLDAELSAIQDELLTPNIENGVSIATKPQAKTFQAALKKFGNDYCLIAVNTTSKKIKADFTLLVAKGVEKMYVMGLGQAVSVADGKLTAEFQPYETKIFLTNKDKANQTNLPKLMAELAAAEKSRFKPGNIVAIGAKTMKELKDLWKGDLSKAPILTASSMHRNYFYFVWGGHPLYCLLDGITDLNQRGQGWNPMLNDKSPWVGIKFKKARINRIKLYTYKEQGKQPDILDCKVFVKQGDKLVQVGEIKDNKAKVIDITFDPIDTTEIKVDISKWQINNYYKGYTLSEIEIYKAD